MGKRIGKSHPNHRKDVKMEKIYRIEFVARNNNIDIPITMEQTTTFNLKKAINEAEFVAKYTSEELLTKYKIIVAEYEYDETLADEEIEEKKAYDEDAILIEKGYKEKWSSK